MLSLDTTKNAILQQQKLQQTKHKQQQNSVEREAPTNISQI